MSYFLPTFLQKRILRYALSRSELLDTDALDLNNLDIVWGRKSTIELRDVGIYIEKISALLKLPRNLVITKAKISILRVTVPADLYQSSIVLDAEGIDIGVRAETSGEEEAAAAKKEKTSECKQTRSSKTANADRLRSTPPMVHDPGGWPDSDESVEDEDARLPTTLDLAQSFVQAEPTAERSELQAAVAQSLYLKQSQSSSEDGLDASELGMGNEVYLPAFLAGFLKGVGDRVQVEIKSVKVDLDLKLASKDDTQLAEDVKIRLVIGSVSVAEVLQNTANIKTRRISVKTIHLLIISEPSLFSNLARSTAPSSPENTQASAMLTAPSRSNETSPSIVNANLPAENMEQSVADLRESQASVFSAQYGAEDEENGTQAGRVRHLASYATAAGSYYEGSMFSDSFYSSGRHSVIDNEETEQSQPLRDSSVFGTAFDGTASMRIPRKPEASQEFSDMQDSPPATFSAFPPPNFRDSASRPDAPSPPPLTAEDSARFSSKSLRPEGSPSSSSAEDLSESKIFSHEQAESMYMSALSGNNLLPNDTPSRVPGGWESCMDEDQQASKVEEPGSSPNESELKSLPPSVITKASDQDNDVLNNADELYRSRTPTTLLTADQEAQQAQDSKIDPALGSRTAAIDHNAGSSQDSVSPSGSGRDQIGLAKRILLIDSIILELPSADSENPSQFLDTPGNQKSAAGSPTAKPEYGLTTSSMATPKHDRGQIFNTGLSEEPLGPATAITVGSIQIVGDVGLTKLTILMIEKLSAFHEPSSPRKRKSSASGPSKQYHYVLAVKSVSWKFLDLVKGSFLSESTPVEVFSKDFLLSEGSDVLLKSKISHMHLIYASTKHKSHTKLSTDRFSIGYADDDILSFDAGLRMRDSTRDISMPMDKDVNLTVIETQGIISVDITTLPLHMVLDLRRLDETFGWFGGFSSMLGLGSSMMSTVTLLDPKAKALPASKGPRGVHFESTAPGLSPRQATVTTNQQQKITARMGGLVFDLQGTKSALRVESTAMKLVSRTEGVGLQIDRLVLSGPINDNGTADHPIFAKLSNMRVEYLTTPKENDLTRLLTLLAPSKDTYDDGDDILVDTLIRQRKKGGVLRATVESANAKLLDMHALQCFPLLAEEAKKLSTVAKYLPEDDRPGLLTLVLIKSLKAEAHVNDFFGIISCEATNAEVAHVTFPTLMALGISHFELFRNTTEELVNKALSSDADATLQVPHPMIMARFIGNEMEPTVKMKFHNARFEYHVTTVTALMEPKDKVAAEEFVSDMISSVATLTSRRPVMTSPSKLSSQGSASSNNSLNGSKALRFDVSFRDSIFGLNPWNVQAKGLVVLTDTHFIGSMPKGEDANATLEVRKAELMIIDDLSTVLEREVPESHKYMDATSTQIQALTETGYVSVSQISAAKVVLQVVRSKSEPGPAVDVEIRDELFVLESCADSTQTVTNILNGLRPPMPKSTALKYQTEVVPVEDMLASFSGEAFEMARADHPNEEKEALDLEEGDMMDDGVPQNLEFVSSFYNPDPETSVSETMADSMLDDDLDSIATTSMLREIGDKNLLESFRERTQVAPGQLPLDFQDDHFGSGSTVGGAAHRWNPKQNTYSPSKEKLRRSPLRVRVRDVHIIWNLFDGFDWQHTRDAISQAVAQVQHKAIERQAARKRKSFDPEEEEEDVIGDFLFNSIYIGIPAKSDPAELARQVNRNIDDLVSETGSYATSTSASASPSRMQPPKPRGKRLRLQRSKHHKLTFELKGVCADVIVFPLRSGEAESSIDIRVQDLEVFDHVPTSTWKKFATYMHDAGERESDTSMIHIEIVNVKPVPNLAASEIILKVSLQILL